MIGKVEYRPTVKTLKFGAENDNDYFQTQLNLLVNKISNNPLIYRFFIEIFNVFKKLRKGASII